MTYLGLLLGLSSTGSFTSPSRISVLHHADLKRNKDWGKELESEEYWLLFHSTWEQGTHTHKINNKSLKTVAVKLEIAQTNRETIIFLLRDLGSTDTAQGAPYTKAKLMLSWEWLTSHYCVSVSCYGQPTSVIKASYDVSASKQLRIKHTNHPAAIHIQSWTVSV